MFLLQHLHLIQVILQYCIIRDFHSYNVKDVAILIGTMLPSHDFVLSSKDSEVSNISSITDTKGLWELLQ